MSVPPAPPAFGVRGCPRLSRSWRALLQLKRTHFHDFMLDVHKRLRHLSNRADPLAQVASDISDSIKARSHPRAQYNHLSFLLSPVTRASPAAEGGPGPALKPYALPSSTRRPPTSLSRRLQSPEPGALKP